MTRRTFMARLESATNLIPDRITRKKDGTVECKKSYFYRNRGQDARDGERLAAAFPEATITTRDDYRNHPAISYFVHVLTFPVA